MSAQRPFRVEMAQEVRGAEESADRTAVAVHLETIFSELSGLRLAVGRLDRTDAEGKALWEGVEAIQHAIQHTRREIAALHGEGGPAKLNRATDELDAVVMDTESATETILSAAEAIDAAAERVAASLTGEDKALLTGIRSEAIRIFEACNFQDITGQRIRKAVGLFHFVEQRVASMIEVWGQVDEMPGAGARPEMRPEKSGDDALLNGPALAGIDTVVSQDDIDSLFN
jgi:chemotaxis protein CheZ